MQASEVPGLGVQIIELPLVNREKKLQTLPGHAISNRLSHSTSCLLGTTKLNLKHERIETWLLIPNSGY